VPLSLSLLLWLMCLTFLLVSSAASRTRVWSLIGRVAAPATSAELHPNGVVGESAFICSCELNVELLLILLGALCR